MWANLLLWDEKEKAGGEFGEADQFWLDTEMMTNCYQEQLQSDPSPDRAALTIKFEGQVSFFCFLLFFAK